MLIRQYRYTLGDYIYEFPAGLVEPDENYHEGAIREMYEETGLKLDPIPVAEAYQKPYFTTVGMTDESCATVYGYASGEISSKAQKDSERLSDSGGPRGSEADSEGRECSDHDGIYADAFSGR